MAITALVSGCLAVILFTIFRSLTLKAMNTNDNRQKKLCVFPSKERPEEILSVTGQLMGFFWIVIGIFLTLTEDKLFSSFLGSIIEFIIVLLPFFTRFVVMFFLKKSSGK